MAGPVGGRMEGGEDVLNKKYHGEENGEGGIVYRAARNTPTASGGDPRVVARYEHSSTQEAAPDARSSCYPVVIVASADAPSKRVWGSPAPSQSWQGAARQFRWASWSASAEPLWPAGRAFY